MRTLELMFLCSTLIIGAEEVSAPVSGVMVFKNGIAAVRRSIQPGKQLSFELACDIQPLLGSLWFSEPVVSVTRQETRKPVAETYPLDNITKTFSGKKVTLLVTSADKNVRELSGTIWDPNPRQHKKHSSYNHVVWIKRADGHFEMISRHLIAGIRCEEEPKAVPLPEKSDLRPVWNFTLERPAEKPVSVDYLTNGIQWQSAYRINLDNDKKMTIAQDVEIVNNLADMNKITLYLASGYANFLNCGKISPMSMLQPTAETVSATGFSGGMTNQYSAECDGVPRCLAKSKAGSAMNHSDFGRAATEASEDISLLAIPDFSLKKGEVCHRIICNASTDYERLVHWTIPPRRDAFRGRNTGTETEIPMDALRFVNPFKVPITASTAEIRDGGIVLAQVKIPWVNPKQSITLDITRALSVTGQVLEYEVLPESTARAEEVLLSLERNKHGKVISGWSAGIRYRVTDIQGELRIKNFRKLPARMLIDLDYSGTFVSADKTPVNTQRGFTHSINPQSRLSWDLTIPAGAEKVLKYRYNIFVRF